MAIPDWSTDVPHKPLKDSFKMQPWGAPPIVTEMQGGNVRIRRRPGDNVSLVSQTIRMTDAELTAFKSWFDTTISGGSSRFRLDVWNGTAYANKVCQFNLATPLQYDVQAEGVTDVTMELRVYEA